MTNLSPEVVNPAGFYASVYCILGMFEGITASTHICTGL